MAGNAISTDVLNLTDLGLFWGAYLFVLIVLLVRPRTPPAMPGYSPNGGTASYGGMSSAGLLSLLFAGVDKDDPRIQAAYDWIQANYTLDHNPGTAGGVQGLYYYYNVFSKSMAAYGEDILVDADGVDHNWRNEIAEKLMSLQDDDGSWVNPDSPRWWEGNKNLVTAWSVIALNAALQ